MNQTHPHIDQLLESWLNAETSLEEERALRAYFRQPRIAPEHRPFVPLFQAIAAEKAIVAPARKVPGAHTPRMFTYRLAAAAAVLLLLSAGWYWWPRHATQPVAVGLAQAHQPEDQAAAPPDQPQHPATTQPAPADKPRSRAARKRTAPAPSQAEQEAAMAEIKQALNLLSAKLNKGTHEARKTIRPLQQLDKSLNKVKQQES